LSMWEAAEAGNLSSLIYHIRNHYQQGGNDKKLKELLNARNPSTEYTLLHTVFSEQNRNKNIHPILKLLLEHGADVSTPNVYNIYPIHAVCMHYPDPYVYLELLLNFKAKLNVRDGDGWTPLHYAARFSVPPGPPMKLLIERGANINSTCGSHKTPLFSLIANGDYPKTLDWLIHTARADLTIRGECLFNLPPAPKTQVGTVLLQVVKFGRIECLSLLLHSPVAMAQLCRAVDENELQYAQHIAR
ncbi:ankyrin repeat-containing domain protein, partial [Mycotypha africana]|uniref:ankyrin repeat-containing domain protein n=1 Tax=Mycotypha africana TaxID=64632 RepID=UPI002301C76A